MAWRRTASCCSYMWGGDAREEGGGGGGGGRHEARATVSAFDCIKGPGYDLEHEESVQEEEQDDVGGGT